MERRMRGAAICLAAAIASGSSAMAWTRVLEAPPAEFPDMESSAACALPAPAGGPEVIRVTLEGENTATNEFEVWFCSDDNAAHQSRMATIGLDCGRAFTMPFDLRYTRAEDEPVAPGPVSIELELLCGADGCGRLGLAVAGGRPMDADASFLDYTLLATARSMRIVARGCETPPRVTVSRSAPGMSMRVVAP